MRQDTTKVKKILENNHYLLIVDEFYLVNDHFRYLGRCYDKRKNKWYTFSESLELLQLKEEALVI